MDYKILRNQYSDFLLRLKLSNAGASKLTLRHPTWVIYLLTVGYLLILLSGLVGNSLVITIVTRLPTRLRSTTNFFVCNLAVADFLVLIVCVVPNLISHIYIEWVLGHFMCKAVPYIQGVSVCASVYTLLAISVERLIKIRHPFSSWITRRKAVLIMLLIWAWAFIVPIPWALFFQADTFYPEYPDHNFCIEVWPEEMEDGSKHYFLIGIFLICYVFPFSIILISYMLICCILIRQGNASSSQHLPDNGTSGRKQNERVGVVKTLFIITFIFFVTWLPLYCITFYLKFFPDEASDIIHNAFPIAQLLAVVGSAINPFVYGLRKEEIRNGFRHMIGSSSGHTHHPITLLEEGNENISMTGVMPPFDVDVDRDRGRNMESNEQHLVETMV